MSWSGIFGFELFGFIWWYLLLALGFIIYTLALAIRTYGCYEWIHDLRGNSIEKHPFRAGLKRSLYPNQTYFRIWDVIRTPFMVPGFLLGFIFFLLKEGAWKFIPVLRKIFGIKLFKMGKGD